MTIQSFLTAYDPLDLPGGSVDPLGFETAYLYLADKILPGITNVVDTPRYFSVLCAGSMLAESSLPAAPRAQREARRDTILRLERLWALGSALATDTLEDQPVLDGLRGVTYARKRSAEVLETGTTRVDTDFPLLSRQQRYGAIGLYGAPADSLRFWDRSTLAPTPDLGSRLADAFLHATALPASIRRAVESPDATVPLDVLVSWGSEAHIGYLVSTDESRWLAEGFYRHPVRARMAQVLAEHPFLEGDDEQSRLARIEKALAASGEDVDLREACFAITTFEASYRLFLLGFERLLWLCRTTSVGSVGAFDLQADPVFGRVRRELPEWVARFGQGLDQATTPEFRRDLDHLRDIRQLLEEAAHACARPEDLTRVYLRRHTEIQHGKFDRGRRKMPWIEETNGRIHLAPTRIGGQNFEATEMTDLGAHPYRLPAADNWGTATAEGRDLLPRGTVPVGAR